MRALAPITDDEFEDLMAPLGPFEPAPLLAIAVSGGPDSMALVWLAERWAAVRSGAAVALIVDHGLRPESAEEARVAAAALAAIGIAADIRRIPGAPPDSGRSAWARQERYRLLVAAAQERGALHLLLGHHRDDQAETFQLNLDRGSGVRGLAGMRPVRPGSAVRLLRPLLAVPKDRLAATARAAGLPVADDPSNRDPAYARVRARQALAPAAARRLADTAARLGDDDAAVEAWTARLAAASVAVSPLGVIRIDRSALRDAPRAVALRILARAAHAVGGRAAPPRQARAAAALDWIGAMRDGKRTLGRATLVLDAGSLVLSREAAPPPDALRANEGVWDGRFAIRIDGDPPPGAEVRALGYGGLRRLEAADAPPAWIGCAPRRALALLPALWAGEALVAPARFDGQIPGRQTISPDRLALRARFRPVRPIAPC